MMGRIYENRLVGLECNKRGCGATFLIIPMDKNSLISDQKIAFKSAVEDGWTVIFSKRLRAYCPYHAHLAYECSCRSRAHLSEHCLKHNGNQNIDFLGKETV